VLVRILRKDYCPRCAEKLLVEGEIDAPVKKRALHNQKSSRE
jgi:hypothetical protein